eukprot:GFYU01006233.1.p1 GENE.GFYU01006233.1~~GFYU01006233.1.p1  ORF type:complete len:454 (-),score=100.16 GFYU01006233.1:162-1523(-)
MRSRASSDKIHLPAKPQTSTAMREELQQSGKLKHYQTRAFALTYLCYACIYFTRKPFSVVKAHMEQSLELSTSTLGAIDTGFLAAYAVGQFMIGPIGDKYGPRLILAAGFFGSACCAAVFGNTSDPNVLIAAWTINGFCQAGCFPLCVKALSPWYNSEDRGKAMGFWTTCQQLGGVASTAFAAWILGAAGWRMAFTIPAAVVMMCCACLLLYLVENPRQVGIRPPTELMDSPGRAKTKLAAPQQAPSMLQVLRMPYLVNLGGAYFCIKIVRYTLMFWLPYYLTKKLGYAADTAGYMSTIFDMAGAFGSILCGYLSEPGKRTVVAAPMCLLTGVAVAVYGVVSEWGFAANAFGMALVGLLVAGPDSVLGAAATQDVCDRSPIGKSAVTTAGGITNGMGSVGAVLQGFLTAYLAEQFGWDSLFYVLMILSVAATIVLVPAAMFESRYKKGESNPQ